MKAFAVVDSKNRTYNVGTPKGEVLVASLRYKEMAKFIANSPQDDLRIVEVEMRFDI